MPPPPPFFPGPKEVENNEDSQLCWFSLSFSLSPLNNNRTLWTVKDTLTDEMK